jgi:hypothetical protein
MSSVRRAIATLQRYPPHATLNIGDVYKFLLMERPVSLRALLDRIAALPDSVPFESTIVTGAAMGGRVGITVNRDGSYRFHGSMRATGFPSFSFRVGAVIQSASGLITLAAQHSGKVFGTDTPGERQDDWDENIADPTKTPLIRNLWPDVSGGRMVVSRSSELAGVLAGATDILKDVATFFVVGNTLGAGLAICLIIGSELGDAGVDVPGMGGVVGIGIIGGALFIWGPLAIGPAFLVGVGAGAIVDALVKIRRMEPFERDFARRVFGDSLDFDRIRLTNLVGFDDRPFAMPTVDNHILLNIGVSDAMFDSPTTTKRLDRNGQPSKEMPAEGQLLIHELTHAWQIQHNPLGKGYVPGWLCEGIREQEFVSGDAYAYGPPGPPWDSFFNEAQAHIVDDWFGNSGRQKDAPLVPGESPQMNLNSPYFGYIDNNIRAGVA